MLDSPIVAMFIIILSAVVTNAINTAVNLKFVYTPEYIEKRRKIAKLREEYKAAQSSGDEKQMKKMEQKLKAIQKMEMELMFKTFRVFGITIIVFYAIYWLLGNLYGEFGNFVYLPYVLPFVGSTMNFLSWYIFSSLVIGIVIRKFLYPPLQ